MRTERPGGGQYEGGDMHKRYAFLGGNSGKWRVLSLRPVCGNTMEHVARVDVLPAHDHAAARPPTWMLSGVISNLRYTTRSELVELRAKQEALGRPQARLAALIPIKKSAAWWDLPQDERRAIFEEQSRHTTVGLAYLPAVARQLYHSRDLGEPFDFFTWFEYAPEHADAFEELVCGLRSSPEWQYVEREIDIRLMLE
jgi:chlorite dismutase